MYSSYTNYSSYDAEDLRSLCLSRGLSPSGNREQLVIRLERNDVDKAPVAYRSTAPRTIRGIAIE